MTQWIQLKISKIVERITKILLLLLKLYDKFTVEGQTPTSGAAYYNNIN